MTFYKSKPTPTGYGSGTCYSHAGDLGDLLAHLPYIKFMGGGHLHLYPAPGMVREPFTAEKVEKCRSFLEMQPYIHGVSFDEKPEGIVLDDWRKGGYPRGLNLTDMLFAYFGQPFPARNEPWLVVDKPYVAGKAIIHRSPRYRSPRHPWKFIVKQTAGRNLFVGSSEEHADFCKKFGWVNHQITEDLLSLARMVAGCSLFCGNQSMPRWLAEGFKVPVHVEEERGRRGNTHWLRDRATYNHERPEFPK